MDAVRLQSVMFGGEVSHGRGKAVADEGIPIRTRKIGRHTVELAVAG